VQSLRKDVQNKLGLRVDLRVKIPKIQTYCAVKRPFWTEIKAMELIARERRKNTTCRQWIFRINSFFFSRNVYSNRIVKFPAKISLSSFGHELSILSSIYFPKKTERKSETSPPPENSPVA